MDKVLSKIKGWERVKQLLQDGVSNSVFPGAVLRVLKLPDFSFSYATGYASLVPDKRKMVEDTIFDIASLTKVVATTSAVMLLVQQKKISLEDKLEKFFPQSGEDKRGITIRDILMHTAGFDAWKPLYETLENEEKNTGVKILGTPLAKEIFLKRILGDELVYLPGEKSLYSDLGFILLGIIIEHVSGKPLDEYTGENIFRKLDMNSTFFVRIFEKGKHSLQRFAATEFCKWRNRIIIGEVHDENARALGGVAGHAGLFSTAGDLDKFAREIINSYYGEGEIFEKEIACEFFGSHTPKSTWVLGWDTPTPGSSSSGRYFSRNSIGHTGFTGVSLWIDLERKVSVILLTNRVHPTRENFKIKEIRPLIHDAVMEALGYAS